jgi:hypothetical protein
MLQVVMLLALSSGMISMDAAACNLTGYWRYAPEPSETPLKWAESAEGSIACFEGADSWKEGTATVNGANITLVFGDQACTGAPKMKPIVKWGLISSDCDKVTMHDVQPNCPKSGSCVYERVSPPPPPPAPCKSMPGDLDIEWLSCRTKQIIDGCKEAILPTSPLNKGINATSTYTPDATHSYGAQWTRDFQYMVSGASDLMDAESVKSSVRYTFAGQRKSDGCMPDRVQIDGQSVMSPGGMLPNNTRNPSHDHAWDNGPFAALLLTATAKAWPNKKLFCDLEPGARKALDFVNRSSATGLVFNDIDHPNCTYGFTDTVAKTGHLLFTSLLFVDASRQLAALAASFGCGDAARYAKEAAEVGANIDSTMADPKGPLWLAATHDNAYPDVWGSAYLVALNLSTSAKRHAAMAEMVAHKETYFRNGQVRSLPYPAYWTRCCFTPNCAPTTPPFGCSGEGTYQNGAYWATPLPYITSAMIATGHADFAMQLLRECVADFKQYGIYEDVDRGFPATSKGVLNYTASATNVLWAAKLLKAHQARGGGGGGGGL